MRASVVLTPARNQRTQSLKVELPTEDDMTTNALRVSAAALTLLMTGLAVAPAYSQTQGMGRRNDRRNARQSGRAAKNACKAGDEKSRMECRHEKRTVKNSNRPIAKGSTPPAQ
jgi:hypothetical protein